MKTELINSRIYLAAKIFKTLCLRALCSFGLVFLTYVLSTTVDLASLGQFSTGISFLLLISLLGRAGSSTWLLKFSGINYIKGKTNSIYYEMEKIHNMVLCITIILSTISAFWVIFFSYYDLWFILLIFSSPGVALLYTQAAVYRGSERAHMGPFMEFGMVSLCVAVIMYLWSLKEKNINIAGFAITLVVATYILHGIFRKHIKNLIPIPSDLYQENKSQLKEDLLANKSYFITELAQYSSQYGMILIASFSLSSSAVGQFTIIQQLAFIINFILGVSVNTISSYFASYGEKKDYLMIKKVKRKVQLIMLIWLIPMLITAFTFSSSILELFGIFSKEADLGFRLLCIVQTLNALSGLSLAVLNMTGHELMVSKISLIVLIIQISLAIVLSLNFGILGLVLAFSASTLLRNGLSVYFETKVLRRVRTI